MKIRVGNICEVSGCPADIRAVTKKCLTIPNPAYFRVARITGNQWAAQRDFKYYKESGDSISFPRGFYTRFKEYLDKRGVGYETEFDFVTSKMNTTLWPEVKLREYQEQIAKDIVAHTEGIVAASVGSGKCHKKGTTILMYDGSLKKIEKIKVGEMVMGVDSNPRKVINTHSGVGRLYKITPVKGECFSIKDDHILSLVHTVNNTILNIPLNDFLTYAKYFRDDYKLYHVDSVDFPKKEVGIDPYFLGIWLADGTSRTQEITNPDTEVINFLKHHAKKNNYNFRLKKDLSSRCPTWSTARKTRQQKSLTEKLRDYNLLQNKHIPQEYKTNSREIRLQLLAGILDGDGSLSGNCFDYISKSKKLAEDVIFVCRSLGLSAYIKKCTKGIKKLNFVGTYYRVSISGRTNIIPTKIKRKQAGVRKQKKNVLRTGFKAEFEGVGEYYGIEVDKDKLYCMGNFIVTHNTVISCWLTRHFGLKTTVLVPNSVIQAQFILEFKKWFNYDVGVINGKTKEIKDVTISTFQSLSADKELCDKLAEQSAMLIVDEAHGGISTERAKILKRFKPSRLYGLSGTPRRSKDDGRTDAIFFYFGNVISSHMMPQVKPTVEVIRTGAKIPVTANYHEMVDYVVENESRNKLIVGLAVGEAMEGKRVLILVKRVDHCKRLKELLPDWGDLVFHADGEDKTRNETLMAMRAGEKDFRILIGTFSLLVAGLDIPSLDRLIIGADCKSDVMVAQGTGRILRLFEGKESAKIYDLFDNLNPIFKNQFYERKRFYDSQKWEIKM